MSSDSVSIVGGITCGGVACGVKCGGVIVGVPGDENPPCGKAPLRGARAVSSAPSQPPSPSTPSCGAPLRWELELPAVQYRSNL